MENSLLKEQRALSVACLIASVAISGALLLSHFPEVHEDFNAALKEVQVHEKALLEAQQLLKDNQAVLVQNQEALANVRKSVQHIP